MLIRYVTLWSWPLTHWLWRSWCVKRQRSKTVWNLNEIDQSSAELFITLRIFAHAQKATEFGEITQPSGLLRRSRSFKVTEFGTIRKRICDFLLVITSYLAPFPRYSLGKAQNRYIFLPLFGLTPRRRVSPGTISVKFLPKGRRWPRYQMAQKHCRKFQSPE